MPFGLRNAAQTFQRFIDHVIRGLDFVYAYIDDLLIASTTLDEHEKHLRILFTRLQEFGSNHQSRQVRFWPWITWASLVTMLMPWDHTPPWEGWSCSQLPQPTSYKRLRSFLGLVNFYRRFVPQCADILAPLTKPPQAPNQRIPQTLGVDIWKHASFHDIKEALSRVTMLAHPGTDAPLSIMTDASDVAVGGVLQQLVGDSWQPIAFYSHKLLHAETKYSAFGRELLAIYLTIKYFRHMLEGRTFCVYTDHKPLIHAFNAKPDRHSPREIRHLDFISQFTTDLRMWKARITL